MRQLNPTLWRTCRVLIGRTRLKLFRQLCAEPARPVTELARRVGVGVSDASQELRRLQSRGLLQAERKGAYVFYRIGADPQVPSAAPLLKALKAACALTPHDEDILRIAKGLSHPRRLALARALKNSPQTPMGIQAALSIPLNAAVLHCGILQEAGLVRREGNTYRLAPCAHPLARALVQLL
jgi:DNA-binding transcriptional ArsR family regulator